MDEQSEELISRGLDADLDRAEMRELYRIAASDPQAPKLMGELALIEGDINAFAARTDAILPARQSAEIMKAIRNQQTITSHRPAEPGLGSRLWAWFRSPHGFSVQPASFAVGLAACLAFVLVLNPQTKVSIMGGGTVVSDEARLSVNDLQFASAQAQLDWTYQFIVKPGGSTKLVLDSGDDRPVRLQLESADLSELSLIHQPPGGGKERVQRLSVDGISFATLRNPKPGDQVTIRNDGDVPVLVYAFTHQPGKDKLAEGEAL